MKFCSSCGGAVSRKQTGQDDQYRYVCGSCGQIHYENPRIIVCCAVCLHDKVLMCRRALEPGLGQWAVPSGFLEVGESLEEGAVRETLEETGLVIDPRRLDLCSVVNMTSIEQVAIMFRVELDATPTLTPGPECLELAFMSAPEIPEEDFAWRSLMGDGPERFYRELRSREFTIQLISLASRDGTGFRSREYKIAAINNTILKDGWKSR
jgi:ADP-ribose pyrophosphatase YjhB (NUDIX family)